MKTQQEQFIHIQKNGNKYYYKDREMTIYHRLDGPAIEGLSGSKEWRVDGKLHRLDGPAVEYVGEYKSWYINGKRLTQEGFIALTTPKAIELTLDQIAEKFGISVDNLKIVK